MPQNHLEALRQRYALHPGRGGCGVGAVAELGGAPTRETVDLALRGLGCLEHRGGAIGDTGDGAGMLLTTDRRWFERFIAPGRHLPDDQALVVGVLFSPRRGSQPAPLAARDRATLRRAGWRRWGGTCPSTRRAGEKARLSRATSGRCGS